MIEVDVTGKRAVLRDLNSLNGCFVNNVRIKGQREALSHGDNVRFGFDTRIWTVDCGSEKTPRQRKGSSGGWEFGCGGAAVSDAPAQPPVRGPPRCAFPQRCFDAVWHTLLSPCGFAFIHAVWFSASVAKFNVTSRWFNGTMNTLVSEYQRDSMRELTGELMQKIMRKPKCGRGRNGNLRNGHQRHDSGAGKINF